MAARKKPIWPALAGVLAGAVAAIAASLVSLPLRSPDDLIANTASVTLATLGLGIVAGLFWRRIHDKTGSRRTLRVAAGAAFIASVVVFGLLEAFVLSRFVSFGVPLSFIVFATIAGLTPFFTEHRLPVWIPLVAVLAAFVVGGLLAGIGDAESGDLSLDQLPTTSARPTTTGPTSGPSQTTSPDASAPASSSISPGNGLDQFAATTFNFESGTATWSVPETFAGSGLDVIAVGRSESLTGSIDLSGPSSFSIDLTTFVSDQDRRDQRVRELFADDPIATFTTTELTIPEAYVEGEVFATDVTGDLTINGITRIVTWAIEARLSGTQLDVTGELEITLTNFDVTPPSIGGFVTVDDSATLEVLFSANP